MSSKDEEMELKELNVDELEVSDSNVRHIDAAAGLEELAENIKEVGLQHPILVQKEDSKYKIDEEKKYVTFDWVGPAKVYRIR